MPGLRLRFRCGSIRRPPLPWAHRGPDTARRCGSWPRRDASPLPRKPMSSSAPPKAIEVLDDLVSCRSYGEPLAWLTGATTFCGLRLAVTPGVYVPRPQTEPLARRAASFPPPKAAVDLCTGAGAIAAVLSAAVPSAHVVATDLDVDAVRCAGATASRRSRASSTIRCRGARTYGRRDDRRGAVRADRLDPSAPARRPGVRASARARRGRRGHRPARRGRSSEHAVVGPGGASTSSSVAIRPTRSDDRCSTPGSGSLDVMVDDEGDTERSAPDSGGRRRDGSRSLSPRSICGRPAGSEDLVQLAAVVDVVREDPLQDPTAIVDPLLGAPSAMDHLVEHVECPSIQAALDDAER